MESIAKQVQLLEAEFAISPVMVAAEADIDPTTLKRLLRNGGSHSNTINRVRKAVLSLRARASRDAKAAG